MSTPEKQKRRFFFAKRHSFCRIFSIHAGNRAIRAGFLDFFPQMWYIQGSQMFPVFTISFHHSKEVFVCCHIVSLRCVFWVGLSIRGGGNDSPRPASQRAAALVLTAAMLTTLTAPAFAETWDIEKGDITVKAGKTEGTNMVSQGEQKDVEDTGTVITGKSDKNTVTIEAENEGDKVEVTLKDLNIDASRGSEAAVSVTGKGDTNIELDGDNELKGAYNRAGLEHNQTVDGEGNVTSGKLTIQDENNDGSLNATGKGFAAGIGGGSAKAGQVTITGGTITATGEDGAGIGGGQGNKGTNAGNADIEISGGTIEATGGYASAGIGGGNWGDANIKITGDAVIKSAVGGGGGAGIGGGQWGNGTVTISGDSKIESALGGGMSAGIGGGAVGNGTVSISGNATIENAQGGEDGAGIGGGYGYGQSGTGDITIEGNTTVNATGGMGSAGIGNGTDAGGNNGQITIRGTKDSSPTVNATGGIAEEDGQGYVGPGGAGIGGGSTTDSEYTPVTPQITLEGKVTIVAKAGKGNAAIGDMNGEQEFSGLAEGSSITRSDSEGNNITLPTDPVPAVPSASGGGSADASVQESVFPGLVVTDKDGQHISYTSIRGNNVLSIRVGRFTASLRASLATLRQLRAEGIDTITFQTILCSTTLSVDELLAMGGEDAEAVLTHRLTASSLTVG